MKIHHILGTLCLSFLLTLTQAQHTLTNFKLPNANTGKMLELKAFKNQRAVVLLFTSSHCAYSKNYRERLWELYETYNQQGIVFLAINSNDTALSPEDAYQSMRDTRPYPFPYLKDANKAVAQELGATFNPEVFVFLPNKSAGTFTSVYQGKIDNMPIPNVRMRSAQAFLVDILDAICKGETPAFTQTPPMGCKIR
ncbi:MAG: redoxin domain-containing protein [Bacteroidota bacterium]